MSTVTVRNNGGPRSRGRSRIRSNNGSRRVRSVTVVEPVRPAPRRRRARRNPPRRRNSRRGGRRRTASKGETFEFNKESINDNSTGYITFGKSLSDKQPFSEGLLKAYHQYKITSVVLRFVSDASSTAEGSISYELDPYCTLTSLKSALYKFPVTKGGIKRWSSQEINGQTWINSDSDQFRILYKGEGSKGVRAGYFHIKFTVQLQGPK